MGADGAHQPVLTTIEPPSGLTPYGPAAESLVWLWWLMFWLGLAIFIAVLVVFALALRQRRHQQAVGEDALTGEGAPGGTNWLMLIGGVAVPTVVAVLLVGLMVTVGANVRALEDLVDNPGNEPLIIEVTGFKWWWDVEYPEADVRTANEIRIPTDRPVEFRLFSADIIHSFWIPQLAGKIDMNPGEENYLRVQADEPGIYRGLCTEYCGLQHALMHFVVEALPPDEFDEWLADRQEPPPEPEDAVAQQGLEIYEDAQCIRCHTVDGVSPHTEMGPDLTDFASRYTLGAGIWENNRENLADWILDPHDGEIAKEGVHMPPSPLDDDELDALIEYLETLE